MAINSQPAKLPETFAPKGVVKPPVGADIGRDNFRGRGGRGTPATDTAPGELRGVAQGAPMNTSWYSGLSDMGDHLGGHMAGMGEGSAAMKGAAIHAPAVKSPSKAVSKPEGRMVGAETQTFAGKPRGRV